MPSCRAGTPGCRWCGGPSPRTDAALEAGDGAAVSEEAALELAAREAAEVLVFDLA